MCTACSRAAKLPIINYAALYMYSHVATYLSLINFLKYFWEVYDLAVWIKMLDMTVSTSHSYEISVHHVYELQQTCKFAHN